MKRALLVAALALAVFAGGALFGRVEPNGPVMAPALTAAASPADLLQRRISSTQEHLQRVPADWTAWAGLGMAYLERSRITGDPSYFPKAEQAVARSLRLRPRGNAAALVARGALANSRHDFAAARRDALAAIDTNPYHAEGFAVLADAETQLGHSAAATKAVQRLLDLRPGLSAFARASYDLEQRGLIEAANDLMRRALDTAVDGHDVAFCRVQLGDLALNSGDLAGAAGHYAAGLVADPASTALGHGQARLDAALGHTEKALAGYAALTRRAPSPGYLLEYANLLGTAGHNKAAEAQIRLASAAHELFTANGGVDGITGAAIAEARGRPDRAVREARAEWQRRQHPDVADALAWALHLAGEDREALAYARRAFGTGARSAWYAYHLGMIETALGDHRSASTHLAKALAINPHFSPVEAPIAHRTLAELRSS